MSVVAALEPSLRPMRRVVINNEDSAFAETLSAMVTSLGYDVTISADARSSYTFDLSDDDIVFLDVLMPNSSG
jgi:CheY-like chemotaxis protein